MLQAAIAHKTLVSFSISSQQERPACLKSYLNARRVNSIGTKDKSLKKIKIKNSR